MNNEKWKSFIEKIPAEFCDKGPNSAAEGFSSDAFHMANEGLAYGGSNLDYLKECKNILDIGCGVPHTLKILKDLDKTREVIGVTINPKEVKSLGREVKDPNGKWDEDLWNEWKWEIMVLGLILKFGQTVGQQRELIETGEKFLVEASP